MQERVTFFKHLQTKNCGKINLRFDAPNPAQIPLDGHWQTTIIKSIKHIISKQSKQTKLCYRLKNKVMNKTKNKKEQFHATKNGQSPPYLLLPSYVMYEKTKAK